MILKAKHVLLLGAFIVLTLLGYRFLPRDEIVFQTNEGEDSSLFENNEDNLQDGLQNGFYEGLQSDVNQNLNDGEMIFVHIEGAIHFPGVKEVRRGTRLFEVIEISGGTTLDADTSKVNLASVVRDEQKIYIPFLINETDKNNEANKNSSNFNSNGYNSNAYGSSNYNSNNSSEEFTSSSDILVNLNYATEEDLQRLDGIGPSMAKKIIEYREQNGYFSSIEDIKNVSGIGEAKYNKIKDNITV